MAKHHDHHTCECAHETLKFCKPCNAVYCVDCREEWQPPCVRSHSGWYGVSGGTALTSVQGSMGSPTMWNSASGDTGGCSGHN